MLFKKNFIPIVFGCSNNYVPYLYVTIISLLDHISNKNFYELNILNSDIQEFSKSNILKLVENKKNVKVNFIDVSQICVEKQQYFDLFKKANNVTSNHNLVAFYFIFIPEFFAKYEKVLYLDADLVILSDVAELYKQDLHDNVLGGILDFQIISAAKSNAICRNTRLDTYFSDILKLDYTKYVNMGVFLVNVTKMKNMNFLDKALNLIKTTPIFYADQDVYNTICNDSVEILSPKWNYQSIFDNRAFLKVSGENTYQDYFSDFTVPNILHYASKQKIPDLKSFFEVMFWKYARKTPYYEALLDMRILEIKYVKK